MNKTIRFQAERTHIVEQCHKTKVHVQLLVAMKKGQPRIVGNEIDFCFLITSQHEHIFECSGRGLSRDPGELETVPVKMNWVNVIAGVTHPNAIAFAYLHMK